MKIPIACPRCGYVFRVGITDPGPWEIECLECDERIRFAVAVQVAYQRPTHQVFTRYKSAAD